MDFRRACFVEKWYFGEGDDTLGEVVWYVAPPGALVYDGPTPFRSLDIWDKQSPLSRPGPIPKQRGKWSNGATIPLYTGKGDPCGAQWFEAGIPSPPPPNPVVNTDGVPQCCVPDRFGVWSGAATSGGSWVTLPPPPIQIRQDVTMGGYYFSAVQLLWPFPTLTGSGLIVCINLYAVNGQAPVSGTPVGWLLERHSSSGTMSQLWYSSFQAAAETSTPIFPTQWSGQGLWTITGYEVINLQGTGSVLDSASSSRNAGVPAVPTADSLVELKAFLVNTSGTTFAQFETTYPIAAASVNAHPPLYVAASHFTGDHWPVNPLAGSFGMAPYPSTIGWVTVPQYAPHASRWVDYAFGNGSWITDERFPRPWHDTATSGDSWVSAAGITSAWSSAATSGDAWVSAAGITSTWAGTATSGDAWVSAAGITSSWASTATSGDAWVTAAVGTARWSDSAASGESWVSDRAGTYVDLFGSATSTTGSASITWGSALPAGELEVVFCAASSAAVAAPVWSAPGGAGWTQLVTGTAPGLGVKITVTVFYRVATGGETSTGTFTASPAAGGVVLRGYALAGITTVTANYQTSSLNGNSNAPATGTLTPTVFSMLCGMLAAASTTFNGAWSPSASADGSFASGVAGTPSTVAETGHALQSSGAVTFSDGMAASGKWVAIIVLLPQV